MFYVSSFPRGSESWESQVPVEAGGLLPWTVEDNCSFSVVLELYRHTELDFTLDSWRTQVLQSLLESRYYQSREAGQQIHRHCHGLGRDSLLS